jgi:isopentenyl-diphosphate delta-isomerase
MKANNSVILVNKLDEEIGEMEKMEAHIKGLLHRAFSIFIFNSKGEMLIHQRASEKYHSSNLWTNACCSHPKPGETVIKAAHRRLKEELGISTSMEKAFYFIYEASFPNGLTEHELDHVLIGYTDEKPKPNPDEVQEWAFISIEALRNQINQYPERFTVWFKLCFERAIKFHALELKKAV